jgi:undecaprenyl diphosphate synthase
MNIPKHIAVIMDGNRRWARERGLSILDGHKKVADEMLEPLIEHAAKIGVAYMTFWAFSTENWNREQREVQGIMQLFRRVIQKRWQRLHEKGVRICVIGNIEKFPADIQESLRKVVEQTKNNKKITTVFALNYGGRDEIVRAIKKVISYQQSAVRNSEDRRLTTESFSHYLDTAGIPDPELIIRPGGEQRLSGFLLWQSEYSELMFPDWYMPDFTPSRLDELIGEYVLRQRRFGK